MTRPTLLLAMLLSYLFCYAQRTDTLVLFYKPGKFNISSADQQKLNSFLRQGWDKIMITGYTDDTEDEEYNLELSKKRSESVYKYCLAKNSDSNHFSFRYLGETMPVVDNSSDDNRAINRRTVIIGYYYKRATPKPVSIDPRIPITKTLDNGLIITYRPSNLPVDFDEQLNNLQMVTNTLEMRQNNLYNNTTRGEILSSVRIVCGGGIYPCKLDSPILINVPIPEEIVCPVEKVKFFNSTLEKGKGIWQEQTKSLYPEVINGRKYIRVWVDDLCNCFNFDFKVDPDCFETDTTQMLIVNAAIKNLTAELKGLNSVYLPRKISDSAYELLFLKNKPNDVVIAFTVFHEKKRVRSFRNERITSFPVDKETGRYVFSTTPLHLYFPRLEVLAVTLRVNKDIYRVTPEKRLYSFLYLNRKTENITVDFTIEGPKGRSIVYRNQPIGSLPYDEASGRYVIDKKFIKELQEADKLKNQATAKAP